MILPLTLKTKIAIASSIVILIAVILFTLYVRGLQEDSRQLDIRNQQVIRLRKTVEDNNTLVKGLIDQLNTNKNKGAEAQKELDKAREKDPVYKTIVPSAVVQLLNEAV